MTKAFQVIFINFTILLSITGNTVLNQEHNNSNLFSEGFKQTKTYFKSHETPFSIVSSSATKLSFFNIAQQFHEFTHRIAFIMAALVFITVIFTITLLFLKTFLGL